MRRFQRNFSFPQFEVEKSFLWFSCQVRRSLRPPPPPLVYSYGPFKFRISNTLFISKEIPLSCPCVVFAWLRRHLVYSYEPSKFRTSNIPRPNLTCNLNFGIRKGLKGGLRIFDINSEMAQNKNARLSFWFLRIIPILNVIPCWIILDHFRVTAKRFYSSFPVLTNSIFQRS